MMMLRIILHPIFALLLTTKTGNQKKIIPKVTEDEAESLIAKSRQKLLRSPNDADEAFALLMEAYVKNAEAPGLLNAFVECFRTRIKCAEQQNSKTPSVAMERLGLGSILLDLGRYQEAAEEFQLALLEDEEADLQLLPDPSRERAASSLYKAKAAVCDWRSREEDSAALVASVHSKFERSGCDQFFVPAVHPYEALMWPCLSLHDASCIAAQYAARAMAAVGSPEKDSDSESNLGQQISTRKLPVPTISIHSRNEISQKESEKKIRVGYISPDFTGLHPLAYLMQDFFRYHDKEEFDVFLYSTAESDQSPEVKKIQAASTQWRVLRGSSPESADIIRQDNLDIMVDLCGYTGISALAEIMAQRVAPVQIGYIGFVSTTAAPYMDYIIADAKVIPASMREYYTENIIYMPHCFFTNSHRYLPQNLDRDEASLDLKRATYGLPEKAFVFCCHSRAEKIDPNTFRSWLRVLKLIPNTCLWLLRDGEIMEQNLRTIAMDEFGLDTADRLIFCDKAPRDEHLRRLGLAELYLDTPAYNAHTVGLDALSAAVPMVSLLRNDDQCTTLSPGEIATDKIGSRLGACFLQCIGLEDMIAPTMAEYEAIMTQCASDRTWFTSVKNRLVTNLPASPLFDTKRFVRNLEMSLRDLARNKETRGRDIYVIDND